MLSSASLTVFFVENSSSSILKISLTGSRGPTYNVIVGVMPLTTSAFYLGVNPVKMGGSNIGVGVVVVGVVGVVTPLEVWLSLGQVPWLLLLQR